MTTAVSIVKFYPGLHQPADAQHFPLACININRIWGRKKPVECDDVIVDSGAFRELFLHGAYRHSVNVHAAELYRLHSCGVIRISTAVAQDYMCEPFIIAKTGLTVEEHQRLTIQRYDDLIIELERLFNGPIPFHVMPVLQGFSPESYVKHIKMYGGRLKLGMWVGVGSVCKRQGNPRSIMAVLQAIHAARPDLRLHGFGVKITALLHAGVRELLSTADSMAWSTAARWEGRGRNDWREAKAFADRIDAATSRPTTSWQLEMIL